MLKRNQKGFTLIELLVVIAIIGILSAVVLASLNAARQKSRDGKRVSDIHQLQLALSTYFDNNQAYPTTAEGIAILATQGLIPAVPLDPLNTGNYVYGYAALTTTSYTLQSDLEGSSNPVLSNDIDAASDGLTCTDTGPDYYYCITP